MENQTSFIPYIQELFRKRYIIIVNFLVIVIIAWVYAFYLVKKDYKAEIKFLPPIGESSFEGMIPGFSLPSLSTTDIMPEQIVTIFKGKALKRKIIDKFKLTEHYKIKNLNKFERTIKAFEKSLLLSVEEKGSMTFTSTISFTITAYHSSPDTVYQIANYAFALLDSSVKAISVDRAHRNKVFIEGQIEKNRRIMDSLQDEMQTFQITNKAYNIPEQAKMSVMAYANLKAAMQMSEIRMNTLRSEFSGETPEYSSLKKEYESYRQKLSQLEIRELPDALPSLQSATKLLPQYTNLLRKIEVENQVILLLTREYEQAKIKESRDFSSLFVVDPAFVPDYKARPKRLMVMAMWIFPYMIFILLLIVYLPYGRKQLKKYRELFVK